MLCCKKGSDRIILTRGNTSHGENATCYVHDPVCHVKYLLYNLVHDCLETGYLHMCELANSIATVTIETLTLTFTGLCHEKRIHEVVVHCEGLALLMIVEQITSVLYCWHWTRSYILGSVWMSLVEGF